MHYFILTSHSGESSVMIGNYADLVTRLEGDIEDFESIEEVEPQKLDGGDTHLYIITDCNYNQTIVEFDSFAKYLMTNCSTIVSIEDWQSS